jgi:hypothetical protein
MKLTLLVALVVPLALAAQERPFQFSQRSNALHSPDGSHTLTWHSGNGSLSLSSEGAGHTLLLRLLTAPAASWSSDSHAFFVDAPESSDFATTFVFTISNGRTKIDLYRATSRYLASKERRGEAHIYVRGLKWVDPAHVLFEVSGHSDSPPAAEFKRCYVADVFGAVAPSHECR